MIYSIIIQGENYTDAALSLLGVRTFSQRAESREQRAESREQRAESREQRAESIEQKAENSEPNTETEKREFKEHRKRRNTTNF